MAPDKGNQSWIIWVLVILAVGFVVLAFKKEKPQETRVPVEQNVVVNNVKSPQTTAEAVVPAPRMRAQESVVVAPKEVVSKESLAIQVYSFKEKARADAAILKLKEKGHDNCYIMISDLGARGVFYRVRVGPFSNEADAQKVLEEINADLKSGIIVTE
ncbi:MAG: SPOR domain-containing protein [Candidatus Omnitrophica bacterium]|nr:SPOR domain-containing protein [Candidatus Omnitrophota bacterium]